MILVKGGVKVQRPQTIGPIAYRHIWALTFDHLIHNFLTP